MITSVNNVLVTAIERNKKIMLLSFLMAVVVEIAHSSALSNYEMTGNLGTFIFQSQTILCTVAKLIPVPVFFVISGFLFFKNYTLDKTKEKYKSRFFSLVIPYFAWNIIYTIFNIVTSYTAIANYFIGRQKFDLSAENIILSIFYYSVSNNHFWYVFDLIVFVLLAPVFYMLLRNKKIAIIVLALFSILFCAVGEWPTVFKLFYRMDSIVFYALGAFIGMHYKEWFCKKCKKSISIISAAALPIILAALYYFSENRTAIFALTLAFMYSIWVFFDLFIEKIPKREYFSSAFIVYAAHGMLLPVVTKLLVIVMPKTQYIEPFVFIGSIVITTVSICFVHRLCKNKIKWLNRILTGAR